MAPRCDYFSSPRSQCVPVPVAVGVYPSSCRTGSCIVGLAADPVKDAPISVQLVYLYTAQHFYYTKNGFMQVLVLAFK